MSSKRPPVLDPPAPRRRRLLDAEERALWDAVAKQTRPLRDKKLAIPLGKTLHRQAPPTPDPSPPQARGEGSSAAASVSPPPTPLVRGGEGSGVGGAFLKKTASPKPVKRALDAPKIAPPLAAFGRREKSSLSRGKSAIDARIDLHGMTQYAAHLALLNFLHRAHRDGLTFVLVITGKGRTVGLDSERGILRRQVPLWLSLPEFRTLVVGYEEAGIGHGGDGALYVRVRRMR